MGLARSLISLTYSDGPGPFCDVDGPGPLFLQTTNHWARPALDGPGPFKPFDGPGPLIDMLDGPGPFEMGQARLNCFMLDIHWTNGTNELFGIMRLFSTGFAATRIFHRIDKIINFIFRKNV